MLVGRLTMHRDGFGFVIPDAASLDANLKARLAGDVFIAPHATGSSMHGDRVLVEVGTIRPDGRAEGRIIRSLSRAHPTVVGIFHYGHRHNYVKPIDEKVTQEIVIPPGMERPSKNVAPPSSAAVVEASGPHIAGTAQSAHADPGRALPFSALQQRLGRKQVSGRLMRQVPVAYLVFDVLYAGGELLLERSLRERENILDALLAAPRKSQAAPRGAAGSQARFEFGDDVSRSSTQVIRSRVFQASTPPELDQLFEAAQARGNEGLMIKDPESVYTPGRRGKSWLKLKRELATLDVVVTAVEYGHGKRIGVLSDYTFAVRDGDKLVNIGKAYSGLTDIEIAEMTKWFLEHTIEDQGFRLLVEPKTVLEVAFNNMMRSDRHESGYALRFPRIVRLRPDKLPEEADTIERAKEIYEKQNKN